MFSKSIVNRFIKYVMFDTQAVRGKSRVPSSQGQLELGRYLAEELRQVGLADVSCDEHAYVIGTLPSNSSKKVPTVALIAHLDTAFEVSGRGVRPHIVKYAGGDIILDAENDIRISEAEFPDLAKFKGDELIVTDGSTLLGGDDKAGIAAIMEAVEWFVEHPEVKHGTVKIVFTPDEEIGHMAALLDLEKLGADFAYTIDGGDVGEICWETFSGAKTCVWVNGRSVHPGKAKNKMKNACLILLDFLAHLPESECPATTDGRQGFYHLIEMKGDVESANADLFIRDHDRLKFEERKQRLQEISDEINAKYGEGTSLIKTEDQYYNMGDMLADKMYIIEYAREAMRRTGIKPYDFTMRGGTDGSKLSARGLPTPNIFKGSMNNHGRYEYQPISSLEKCCEVIKRLVEVIEECA